MMHREMPRVLRRVIVAGMFLIAGCAGRPEGVLVPSGETPPGVSTVDLLVATTRAPSEQPGVLFSGNDEGTLTALGIYPGQQQTNPQPPAQQAPQQQAPQQQPPQWGPPPTQPPSGS